MKKKFLAVLAVALVIMHFATNASANSIVSYAGQGNPIIGAKVIATGGDVIATFVQGSGLYENFLYLESTPYENANKNTIGNNWIFENHLSTSGTHVNLGYFAPGTELIFNDLAWWKVVQGNWYTGPASRNSDGLAHAFVDSSYTGPFGGAMVGFEDLAGLGDAGYEDIRYTFTNVKSQNPVPEPGTLLLLGSGIGSLGFFRKKIIISKD